MYVFNRRLPLHLLEAAAAVALILIVARATAPYFIQRAVNHALSGLPGYRASIGDVDLAVWRGAYQIEDIDIRRVVGGAGSDRTVAMPFVHVDVVDLSVSWRALFTERAIVGEMVLQEPELNLTRTMRGPPGVDWHARIEKLFPFTINRIELVDASVRYRDPKATPATDLVVDRVYGSVENITNSERVDDPLPARVSIVGRAFDGGELTMRATLDPWALKPAFDADVAVRGAPLVAFNGYADEYGAFDFEKGTLSVFIELAAGDGKFEGYVKPLLHDVAVADPPAKQARKPWWRAVWEQIVGGASEIVENQPIEQVATKIPITGRIDGDPQIGLVPAVGKLLVNAFIRALRPQIDRDIDEDNATRLKRGAPPDPRAGAQPEPRERRDAAR